MLEPLLSREDLELGIDFTLEFQVIRLKASRQGLIRGDLKKPLKNNSLLFTNFVQKLWVTLKKVLQMPTK